jgi:hypothetical protein
MRPFSRDFWGNHFDHGIAAVGFQGEAALSGPPPGLMQKDCYTQLNYLFMQRMHE